MELAPYSKKTWKFPPDYDGVLYISMDDQRAWQMALVGELKGAGLDVDANRIL